MNRRTSLVLVLSWVLIDTAALAAPRPAPAPKPKPAKAMPLFQKESDSPMLCIGAARSMGAQAASFAAGGMAEFFGKGLDGAIVTSIYPDSEKLGDALASQKLDAAWLPPLAYVRATEKSKAIAVARLTRHGTTTYRSVLFVRAGSPLHSIADLQGHSVMWGNTSSASAYVFPRALLRKQGQNPDTLFSKQLTGADHKEICQAVLNGTVEVGASISDEQEGSAAAIVDGCREAGFDPKLFAIVDRSDPIPNDVIAVREGFPPAMTEKLRGVLLSMGTTGGGREQLKEVFHADGFAPVSDQDFAAVREALAAQAKK